MAEETILIVDADQELDQKIISTLEAEGYLVFACANHVVTAEMADKCRPSLIYIKPISPSAEGFLPCRTIHTIPKLRNVPIVLLASLKGAIEAQHTEHYGIVDFLGLNFTSEELVAKTVSVLASVQRSPEPEAEAWLPVDEDVTPDEPSDEEGALDLDKPPVEPEHQIKSADTGIEEEMEFKGEDEMQQPSPSIRPLPRRAYRQSRLHRPSPFPWLLGILILALLGAVGFFAYRQFKPIEKPVAALSKETSAKETPAPEPVATPVAEPIAPAPPAPEPLSSEQIPPRKEPVYSAQVGAYKTEEMADILVKKLQGKGYDAFLQKGVTKDNAPIIRVLVGNFPDRKTAMKLAGEIQTKEQIKTTIFTN